MLAHLGSNKAESAWVEICDKMATNYNKSMNIANLLLSIEAEILIDINYLHSVSSRNLKDLDLKQKFLHK